MRKCYNCKFCDIDFDFDEEEGEEYEILTCDKGNDTDSEEECADYKEYIARKPKETSSECDWCKYLGECNKMSEVQDMGKFFRFYVKDEDGNVEMQIDYWKYGEFTVHYPRYEYSAPKFRANTCFARMNSYQVAMLIFAYSESEYFRFVEEMEKFYKELDNEQ